MCFFRKRKAADKAKEDRLLIETNSKSIDALIVLSRENTKLKGDLKSIQELLKYLAPSDETKIKDFDTKISKIIGELRSEIVKSESESTKAVEDLLIELKLAIADRNTVL